MSRTIALIDSELQSHELTLAILRDRGFRVVTARDPASALSLIREEKPALAMVDAQILNAGAPTLSTELKSLSSVMGIPVLLMSADLARAERAVDTRRSCAQGVLYKPISPKQLSEHLGALLPEDAPGRGGLQQSRILQDLLRKVRTNFADQLSEIYGEIREAILDLVPGRAQGPALSALRLKLNSLARGADIHEFHLLGQTALGLERLVVECLEGTKTPDSTWLALVRSRLNLLGKACQDARRFVAPPPQQGVVQGSQDRAPHVPRKLFLLEDDAISAQHLSLQLQHFDFHIQLFSDPGELAEAVGAAPPHAVVCGLTHLPLKAPEQLEHPSRVPVVVISREGDLDSRLKAVKAGACGFFVKPVDACALADCLDKIAAPEKHPPYRVLIVEDEPTTAALNSNILRKAGMLTQVVNDPLGFLDTLSAFLPDVILMDIYMPRCNGVQLAAVLRQQEAYVGIPIIFLSTEKDVDRQLLALRYGGDEFLTKPIQGPHLVSMVITRAQRSRAIRDAITHDSLTGLLNHSAFIDHTRREFSRARRRKAQCAMALIDLDHFNVINERFGLSAADGCLKDLAHILRQRLRTPDVVGRFGPDEFAVLLADTDARNAFKVMDDLRASFSLLEHQGPDATFCATFSCGLADIRGTEVPLDLRMRAEHALRCARQEGGNLVKL